MDPTAALGVRGNLELNQVAREADERLRQALASLDPAHFSVGPTTFRQGGACHGAADLASFKWGYEP